MNIQLMKIYPYTQKPDSGTAHVQLPDLGIEIKNIPYTKKKNSVAVFLPAHYRFNEKGEKIMVPCIKFMDKDVYKSFMDYLRKAIYEKLTA